MTKKIALPVFVLFAFVNLAAMVVSGFGGIVDYFRNTNGMSVVLGVDLIIALTWICMWMVRDARKSGRAPLGYVVLTIALGSIGPLLYVLRGRGTLPE